MIECVVNISEGRRDGVIDRLASTAGAALLDLHRDADHNRSVLTLIGESAVREVTVEAISLIDLTDHHGVHPRFGVVDVVPFVPLGGETLADAIGARDRYADWAGNELGVPCFLYGTDRTLPEVRRRAFVDYAPDTGPDRGDPRAGAIAVGARPALIAYNLWLAEPDLMLARRLAGELRGPAVRALALALGNHVQVSMNLIAPDEVGPDTVYDYVAASASIERAELVGLVPESVLDRVERDRWPELDLAPDRTVEARAAARGHTIE